MTTILVTLACVLAPFAAASQPAAPSSTPAAPPMPPVAPGAVPAWLVIDADLTGHAGELTAISSDSITFRPPGTTETRSIPLDRVMAVVRSSFWSAEPVQAVRKVEPALPDAPALPGALELVDGSRIIGAAFSQAVEGDNAAWVHPLAGRILVPLDNLRRLALDADAARWTPVLGPLETRGTRDTLLLSNGDRLEGFVAAVQTAGDPTNANTEPHVRVEVDGQGRLVPLSRIREARLVNPAKPPVGPRVYLSDSSVFPARSVRLTSPNSIETTIEREPGKPGPLTIQIENIRAVAFDASRLLPLARLPIDRQESADPARRGPAPVRLWESSIETVPTVLGADDLLMPGPMSVRWILPPGAARIGGWLLLPNDSREWGDCIAVVRIDDAEVLRQRLNAGTPTARLDATIPSGARTLSITIEAGEYGPIQDRVVLRRMLLARPAATAP